ncbi:hypothetical protein [Oceanobacillus massiliensis]|uniref:hypothetical protein n=1 Tax=Oceanobacillus massiliensis TaxID=1465765 RepID=UPI0030191D07
MMEIKEVSDGITYYLNVESHYYEPTDGKGKDDAIIFEMGQHGKNGHELDAGITCSAEDARTFAKAILQKCDKIGK